MLKVAVKEAPSYLYVKRYIWIICARDFVSLIFSSLEFVIEDSVVQRDLLKI